MSSLLRSAFILSLASAALAASAQNLVVNPGFETGDFTGWTVTRAPLGTDLFVAPEISHSGTYHTEFTATMSLPDAISQSIATVAGQTYTVSYYLRNNDGPLVFPVHEAFVASFGGTSQTFGYFPTSRTYTLETFDVVATGSFTTLRFAGYDDYGSYLLDDVSVQATPEPATMAALGLGAMAMLRRRKSNS